MAQYARMSSNFVNLRRLYSSSPHVPSARTVNSVNLGNLYSDPPHPQPRGFAYYEDGSIFISPFPSRPDDDFEADMKLYQQFVHQPTPKIQAVRKHHPDRQRLVIIERMTRAKNTRAILARNAIDGASVGSKNHLRERIDFETDASQSRLISSRVDTKLRNGGGNLYRYVAGALKEFRGTLVNGVLQPRTRLSNALRLTGEANESNHLQNKTVSNNAVSHMSERTAQNSRRRLVRKGKEALEVAQRTTEAKLSRQEEADMVWRREIELSQRREADLVRQRETDLIKHREAMLNERERQLFHLQQKLLDRAIAPPSPNSNQAAGGLADSDYKQLAIEAKERELEHKEQLLKWKRRAFMLEQQLAKTGAGPPAETPGRRNRVPTALSSHDKNDLPNESFEGDTGDASDKGQTDPFSDFDLESPPRIPKRIQEGRTRIRLPR